VPGSQSTVTFTVTGASLGGWIYEGSANHDLDGDSSGTVIVIDRP
jgi:hypothetical protein